MSLSGLFGTDSANDLCAIFNCLLGMKSALFAGESLINDLCVLVDAEIVEGVVVVPGSGRGGK
jgi:hypothetical protein